MTRLITMNETEIIVQIANADIDEVTEVAHQYGFTDDVASKHPDKRNNGGANNYGPLMSFEHGNFNAAIFDGDNPLCALDMDGIYIMFTTCEGVATDNPSFIDDVAKIVSAFNESF